MSINHIAVYVSGHQTGLPGAPNQLTPGGEAGCEVMVGQDAVGALDRVAGISDGAVPLTGLG